MNCKILFLILISMLLINNLAWAEGELDLKFDDLTTQISAGIRSNSKSRIAVIEFSSINGQVTGLGRFHSNKGVSFCLELKIAALKKYLFF